MEKPKFAENILVTHSTSCYNYKGLFMETYIRPELVNRILKEEGSDIVFNVSQEPTQIEFYLRHLNIMDALIGTASVNTENSDFKKLANDFFDLYNHTMIDIFQNQKFELADEDKEKIIRCWAKGLKLHCILDDFGKQIGYPQLKSFVKNAT